jgi:Fe-S-cluster-containing dehydrogenase component
MSLNRRDFLKTLGGLGLTLAAGNVMGKKAAEERKEFKAVLVDSTLCIGCQGCEMACAEAHGFELPEDFPEAGVERKTGPDRRTVVNAFETEQGEAYVKKQCMHCNEPACAAACLTKAIIKTKEGPVVWRSDKCMGCRYCMISCPFEVPKFEYNEWNPKIVKCDMCAEKTLEGGTPECVSNCPTGALTFGTRRDMIAEAHKRIAENPDTYVSEIYGEDQAGGTSFIYLSSVPFDEIGFNTAIKREAYPKLTKGFLYSVPSVFLLLPPALLGIYEATKKNQNEEEETDNE